MPELHVRVVCARHLRDQQFFGRQDPFCKIKLSGSRKFKTRVHDNGGRSPVWNEVFTFETYDPQLDQLHITVKDKGFTENKFIGECRLPVNMFLHGNLVDGWYPLNNGCHRAGEINLRVQLVNAGPAVVAAAPVLYAEAYPVPQEYPPRQYPPPPNYGYAPPPPEVVMAPAPVVYEVPPPTVVYEDNGGYYDNDVRRRRVEGVVGAEMAMDVGAGALGGLILGDVLFD
jgi:hypothetical protein